MEHEEALKILRGGKEGVIEWNVRRLHGEEIPDLRGIELKGAALRGINFENVHLDHSELSEADLAMASMENTSLNSARLWGSDLQYSNLFAASLQRALLSNSLLNGVNLRYAKLDEAKLAGCQLESACLDGVSLQRANLIGANFQLASFRATDLREAVLSDARIGCTLIDCDLSTVVGLDKILHEGPSSLSLSAINTLPDKIRDEFLKGCGMTSTLLQTVDRSETELPSYAPCRILSGKEDETFANRLRDHLRGLGVSCWSGQFLPYAIGPTEVHGLDALLNMKILICISRDFVADIVLEHELEELLKKEKERVQVNDCHRSTICFVDLNGLFADSVATMSPRFVLLEVERLVADFSGWEMDDCFFSCECDNVLDMLKILVP